VRYSSLSLLRDVVPRSSRWRRHVPFALFAAAAAALTVALSRPAVVMAVPASGTNVILVMDVSRSMCSSDIPPTRLQVAQEAAADFVRRQPGGTQVGLVAFSGFAAIVAEPTTDRQAVIEAIESLTTGRRTAIGSGILTAIDAIAEVDPNVAPAVLEGRPGAPPIPVAPGAYAPAIIVVLTDGANNAGPEPQDAARQAVERGLRIHTIGYGTPEGGAFSATCDPRFIGREPDGSGPRGPGTFGGGGGAPQGGGSADDPVRQFRRGIDEPTLIAVAEQSGGTYHPAESAAELATVFAELPTSVIMGHEVVEVSVGFVGLGGVLLAGALLLGRAWRPLP
jgi:Ca-activated chloride channel family protein